MKNSSKNAGSSPSTAESHAVQEYSWSLAVPPHLGFTLAASRILETQTNSLSCQRKWFTWLSKSRRVWSRHKQANIEGLDWIMEVIYTDQAEISGTLAELSVACTPRITPQPWHEAVPVSGNKDVTRNLLRTSILLTWFAYQIKNSNTAQDALDPELPEETNCLPDICFNIRICSYTMLFYIWCMHSLHPF